MPMDGEGAPDIDLLLASLRADSADTHAFMQALAARLDGALPGRVTVERGGGLFSRGKTARKIELDAGDHRYTIEDAGHGRLQARQVRVVRGVALKTDDLPVDSWLAELARDLAEEAEASGRGREALERLLLGR